MTLSDYYTVLCDSLPFTHSGQFSRGDVAGWLEVRFGLPRRKARQYARILHNWVWFSYVPSGA